MKVAVVTDDGNTISQHFGRAEYYEVLTLEDGKVTGRERRAKPAHGHNHHQDAGAVELREEGGELTAPRIEAGNTHGAMLAPIGDCAVLISRGMGRGAWDSLRDTGIEPIITDVREVDEAVRLYLDGELTNHPERLH